MKRGFHSRTIAKLFSEKKKRFTRNIPITIRPALKPKNYALQRIAKLLM